MDSAPSSRNQQTIMKKFKFIAGFAALAMLGACSSDAPEAPVTPNDGVDNGDVKYITMKIADSATRATTDGSVKTVEGSTDESAIKDVQLVIEDASGNVVVSAMNTGTIGTDKTATFKITSFAYNTLKSANTDNTTLNLYVYVNGKANGGSSEGQSLSAIKSGSYANDTWTVSKGFLMSAAQKIIPNNGAEATTDTGKSASPWDFIGTPIEVTRLAVRFDYVSKATNDTYKLESDASVSLKVVAIAPETRALSTYRVTQYSSTGKDSGKTPFSDTTNKYYVTSVNSDGTQSMGATVEEKTCLVPGTTTTVYGKPNCLTTEITTPTFELAPYAVVKAEITDCSRLAKAKAAGETVYAINGVLLGGLTDLYDLAKTANGKVTITNPYNATDNPTEYSNLNNALLIINGFLDQERSVANKATFKNDLETQLDAYHLVKFEPVKENNVNHYYTYYSSYIIHDNEATKAVDKYMVLRNHIYNIGVSAIKFLGHGYDCPPDHEIQVSEKKDMYIKLTITPAKWTLNHSNESLVL